MSRIGSLVRNRLFLALVCLGFGYVVGHPQLLKMVPWIPVSPAELTLGGDGFGKDHFFEPDKEIVENPLVRVPSGSYVVGPKESPQTVDLSAFFLQKFEVTYAQFRVFVEDNGYDSPQWWSQKGWAWKVKENISRPGPAWGAESCPAYPVHSVSRYEAEAYAKWAGMRLPTVEEWEAAARGPEGLLWPWGNDFHSGFSAYAYYYPERRTRRTAFFPVGYFEHCVSPCGAIDMTGGVKEWTLPGFMHPRREDAPALGSHEVSYVKGGNMHSLAEYTRLDLRVHKQRPTDRVEGIGFRCFVDDPSTVRPEALKFPPLPLLSRAGFLRARRPAHAPPTSGE